MLFSLHHLSKDVSNSKQPQKTGNFSLQSKRAGIVKYLCSQAQGFSPMMQPSVYAGVTWFSSHCPGEIGAQEISAR